MYLLCRQRLFFYPALLLLGRAVDSSCSWLRSVWDPSLQKFGATAKAHRPRALFPVLIYLIALLHVRTLTLTSFPLLHFLGASPHLCLSLSLSARLHIQLRHFKMFFSENKAVSSFENVPFAYAFAPSHFSVHQWLCERIS